MLEMYLFWGYFTNRFLFNYLSQWFIFLRKHLHSQTSTLHQSLSKYLTTQDTCGTPTPTKHNRTLARLGNLPLQPRSTIKLNSVFFCPLYWVNCSKTRYETLQACASISVSKLCNFPLQCFLLNILPVLTQYFSKQCLFVCWGRP